MLPVMAAVVTPSCANGIFLGILSDETLSVSSGLLALGERDRAM